jgi:hypothetical protein
LKEHGVTFLFTDRHASVPGARFSQDIRHLDRIDWKILQNCDFSRDNDDLDKTSRYQAEALVHRYMPVGSLLGIACCDGVQKTWVEALISNRNLDLKVITRPGWYFQ